MAMYAVVQTEVVDNISEVFTGFRSEDSAKEYAEALERKLTEAGEILSYKVSYGPSQPAANVPLE
jgi:hypothetical protein